MGCSFFQDPLISGILNKLGTKASAIVEKCLLKKGELEAKKALKLSERHSEFKALFDKKVEISEEKIQKYNKEEFDIDKDLIVNEVEKTKQLYGVGKELADEFKNGLIKKFTDQLRGAPAIAKAGIQKKIDQITSYTPVQFLHSEFGKPLKKALEGYGVNSATLEKYCEELNDDRDKRREKEREEFNIQQNVFRDDFSDNDLYDLIKEICKVINGEEV